MSEKAMENQLIGWENLYSSQRFWEILLMIFITLAAVSTGYWWGGWQESQRLQSELSQIADINECFGASR